MSLIYKKLYVLLLTTLCVYTLSAQVVQIGSGVTTNTITQASPVNTYYRRAVSQFVYTRTELNNAGVSGANTLNQIGFYVTSNPLFAIPGYTIKMKHTTRSNVNQSLGTTGWTEVKSAFSYSPNPGGYDMIVLDVPFDWNGSQNIAVEICWSQVQPTWDASGQCRIFNSSRGYRYTVDDDPGSICGTDPSNRDNYKPQVQLVFKSETTWTGGGLTVNWNNPLNWDAGVPDKDIDAFIPSAPLLQPYVGLDAECKNLTIEPGATLTLSDITSLSVYGDVTNNGSLIPGNGEIILTGKEPNKLNGAANQDIYNLTVTNINGAEVGTGSLNIRGSLTVGIAAGSFKTNNKVTLISDENETARIPELASLCLYTLDMSDSYGDSWNGGYITVYIDGVEAGTYFAVGSNSVDTIPVGGGKSLELRYTAGEYENENSYVLRDPDGNIIFSDGPTPGTGSVFTTTSTCSFFNPIAGNITMQRYIDAGETNWRFLTTPVAGTTLEDWDDDFITSGYPGSDHPEWPTASNPWPSIYFYDESQAGIIDNGFTAATNSSNSVNVGQGVWVWSGDTITGTQPFTIDVIGAPNAGDINLPVTYTNSGSPNDDGWSMVGNPYPCTIDWDSPNWDKNNINDAVYIWNPDNQQFATYVAGVGTNGGSRYIASSQAFWIQANASSPSVQIHENCKYNEDQAFLKQATNTQQLLRFSLNVGGNVDEAVLRFINGATNVFDAQFDAHKMSSADENMPYISMLNNGEEMVVNSFNLGATVSIPIKTNISTGGLATLSFNKENLTDLSCAVLEDLKTGVKVNLLEEDEYTFQINGSETDERFMLHIWNSKKNTLVNPTCHNSSNGEVTAYASGNGPWIYNWTLPNGSVINNQSTNTSNTITQLTSGTVSVEIVDESSTCGNSNYTIELVGPQQIGVVENIQMPSDGLNNGLIELEVSGGEGNYSFVWSNGEIVKDIFNLAAGVYDVEITDDNGCVKYESYVLDVTTSVSEINFDTPFLVFPNPTKDILTVVSNDNSSTQLLKIYDVEGKQVEVRNLTSKTTKIDVSALSGGLYYFEILSDTKVFKGKLVVSH